MTENNKKRFTDNETDCLIDSSFTDNLTKKIYGIDEWERIIGLCNNLWEQTVRFEKYNQDYIKENEQLKSDLKHRLIVIKALKDVIKELQNELFESEKDYLIETYYDNPARRDDKIESLKEEFKRRFGRNFE